MFAKSHRLNRIEFTKYFASGRRTQGPYFTIISTDAPALKVAAVVGKKVSKSAVDRNRFRREIYGELKRQQQAGQLGDHAYIVIAKPSLAGLSRIKRLAALKTALAQSGKAR